MTDAELAKELNIPAAAVPKLTPGARATYVKMIIFAREWNLFAAGLGPRPATPALVDTERSRARRKFWKA